MKKFILDKKILITSILVVIFCFINVLLNAQKPFNPEYKFRNYSIEQGLPSSETYDIEQDNEGNIWIATDRGVVKYNGRKFKTYTKKDGLVDDVVFQIYKDPFGRLWFLTIENQLCYYEKGEIKKYKYNYQIKKNIPISSHADKDIVITKDSIIYYSTRNKGFFRINKIGEITKKKKQNLSLEFFKIKKELLWATNYFAVKNLNIQYVYYNNKRIIKTVENRITKKINSKIVTDKKSKKSLYALENEIYLQNKPIITLNNLVIISLKSINNEIWIGTIQNGILIYENKKNKFVLKEHFLKNYSISNIHKDINNGYWISTLEKGVFYLPMRSIKSMTRQNGLSNNYVRSILGCEKNIYLGFIQAYYQKIVDQKIFAISKSDAAFTNFGKINNEIIISTGNGVILPNNKIHEYWIRKFCSSKNYCYGVRENVYRYSINGKIDTLFICTPKAEKTASSIVVDQNENIFVGNKFGLYLCKNKKLIPFKHKEFFHKITDLAYSKFWGIIIATRNNGLFRYVNNQFIKIKGTVSNDITSLFIDENNCLWIGTLKGLNFIKKSKPNTIYYLSKNYGLISNEISCIYVDEKNAWIGTNNGLSIVDLKDINISKSINKISLEQISYGKKKIVLFTKNIVIPYDEDIVKIKFNTVDFLTKGKYRYRFNKTDEWSYIYESEITLINPKDGFYNLEVAFLNETNRWSPIQKIASFEIDAPYWKKTPFFVVIFLVIAYLIYLYIRFKRRQFETKQKLIMLEQKALFAQMNPHFIFNTLNSIQSFLIYNENDKAEYFLSKFSKLLRETLHISRNTTVPIKKEMDMLEKYLELEQMRFSNKFKWEINYHFAEEIKNCRIPNMLIQPFIENSIKHGFTEKRNDYKLLIELHLLNDKTLLCVVEDNGIGRSISLERKKKNDTSKEHVSYGEKITNERLKSYNKKGEIPFESKVIDLFNEDEAIGTRVEIVIPILSDEKEAKNRFKL